MSDNLAQLSQAGVSIWLDDLSRERLNSGNLAGLIRDRHVVGVTTNPTIFANALSQGESYDEQVRELAARGADVHAVVRELTTTDVRNAADLFRDIYTRTNGVDGRVSIEVDPRWRVTRTRRPPRRRTCGRRSTGRTSSSRSRRPRRACRRSPRPSPRASASTSR